MTELYRQGDIPLQKVDKLPKNTEEKADSVIAYGEKTGHKHAVRGAKLYTTPNGMVYVQVETEAELIHDEHGTILLPTGIYEVVRQREYNPAADRVVAD